QQPPCQAQRQACLAYPGGSDQRQQRRRRVIQHAEQCVFIVLAPKEWRQRNAQIPVPTTPPARVLRCDLASSPVLIPGVIIPPAPLPRRHINDGRILGAKAERSGKQFYGASLWRLCQTTLEQTDGGGTYACALSQLLLGEMALAAIATKYRGEVGIL